MPGQVVVLRVGPVIATGLEVAIAQLVGASAVPQFNRIEVDALLSTVGQGKPDRSVTGLQMSEEQR